MKLAYGTAVHLLGWQKGCAADRMGVRLMDIGWVVGFYGAGRCCLTPEDCSLVEFANDAGFPVVVCVQDCHMRAVVRQ
jgi:hypothetical protein